jgi:LysM repeat protein
MPFKKIIILTCLFLLPLSALAQGEVQTYVIKKGDTLWGISQRYLKDPHYWPSLWSNNPFVTNPHLIYPGQKIAIYDGRIEIVPVDAVNYPGSDQSSQPIDQPAQAIGQLTPQESVTIKVHQGAAGFISSEGFDAAGTLIDTIDNHLLIGTGETVFLDMGELAATHPGELFSLFEIKDKVVHPQTGEKIGFQVDELGILKITEVNAEVATGEITKAFKEILRGAKLRLYQPAQTVIELRRAKQKLSGTLIDAQDGRMSLSQYDVIYVDLGADDGLQVGNLLNVSRSRNASDLSLKKKGLKLPEILLGSAVVIETQARTSAALVLKVLDPLYRGDRLTTVTE